MNDLTPGSSDAARQTQQRTVREEEPPAAPLSKKLGFVALFVAPLCAFRLEEPLMMGLGARP